MKSGSFFNTFCLTLLACFCAQTASLVWANPPIKLPVAQADGYTEVSVSKNSFSVGETAHTWKNLWISNFMEPAPEKVSDSRLIAMISPTRTPSIKSIWILFKPKAAAANDPHKLFEFKISSDEDLQGFLDLGTSPGIVLRKKIGDRNELIFRKFKRTNGRDFMSQLGVSNPKDQNSLAGVHEAKNETSGLFKEIDSFAQISKAIRIRSIDGILVNTAIEAYPVVEDTSFIRGDIESDSFVLVSRDERYSFNRTDRHLKVTHYSLADQIPGRSILDGTEIFSYHLRSQNLLMVLAAEAEKPVAVHFFMQTDSGTKHVSIAVGINEVPMGFVEISGLIYVFFLQNTLIGGGDGYLSSVFVFDKKTGFEKELKLAEKVAGGETDWFFAGRLDHSQSAVETMKIFVKRLPANTGGAVVGSQLFSVPPMTDIGFRPHPKEPYIEALPESFSVPIHLDAETQVEPIDARLMRDDSVSLGDYFDRENKNWRWRLALPPNLMNLFRNDRTALWRELAKLKWLGSKEVALFGVPADATEIPARIQKTMGDQALQVYEAELVLPTLYDPTPKLVFRQASSGINAPDLANLIKLAAACGRPKPE
jgi:hypothetical protein